MPAAHRFRHHLGLFEAKALQRFAGLGIGIDAGEDQAARTRRERRATLEQTRVMVLHLFQRAREVLVELRARHAAEAGETRKILIGFRQFLRLLVVDHLHAMFERAQDSIGLGEVFRGFWCDPGLAAEGIEHVQRARPAQRRPPPAIDQLLRLHEEFDLANAATAKLEIVPGNRDLVVPFHGIDLPLHRVDIRDGTVIEVFPPDEGLQFLEIGRAGGFIARDNAGLDHRRAFPVLAHGFVIGERGIDRHGDGCGAGIGPEAQIDAQHIAIRRALREDTGHRLDDGDAAIEMIRMIAQGRACGS